MRILKSILILFSISIFLLLTALDNSSFLNYVAKKGIEISKLDIKYRTLKGGLISGLKIEELNYQNRVKFSLEIEINYSKLLYNIIEIERIKITNISIDKDYLEEISEIKSTTKEESEPLSFSLKEIRVKNLLITTDSISFREYNLSKLYLNIKDIFYNFSGAFGADIKRVDIVSNIANLNIEGESISKNYRAVAKIEPKREFISTLLREQNITIKKIPNINISLEGNFEEMNIRTEFGEGSFSFKNFIISPEKINLLSHINLKREEINSSLKAKVNSNIANLNLDINGSLNLNDINNSLKFEADTILITKPKFIKENYLKEFNLTLQKSPKLYLKAKGDLNKIDTSLNVRDLKLLFDIFKIESRRFNLKADYNLKENSIKAFLESNITSNSGNLNLRGATFFNIKKVEKSLKFKTDIEVVTEKEFIKKNYLRDIKLKIEEIPKLSLRAEGDLKKIDFIANFGKGEAFFNDIIIEPKFIKANGNYLLKSRKLSSNLKIGVNSNVAKINLNSKLSLIADKIEKSLKYRAEAKILPNKRFIEERVEELSISKIEPLKIDIIGDLNRLRANIDFFAKLIIDKISLSPNIHNTKVDFNIKSRELKSSILLDCPSSLANMKTDTILTLNLKNIDKSLNYSSNILIDEVEIPNLNLKSLTPFRIRADGTLHSLKANLSSPKIFLNANSSNLKRFNFNLNTNNIDIKKIVKLPKEVLAKFINLKIGGFYNIATQKADINGDLNIDSSLNFKLKAKKDNKNLKLKIDNSALNLKIEGEVAPLNLRTDIEIVSIKKLQKLFQKLYLFESKNIDGRVDIQNSIKDRDIFLKITSKKIKYQNIYIKNLLTKVQYQPDKILIKNFSFRTDGFKEKSLNREFKLTKEGVITLGKKMSFDIDFNNIINIKGFKNPNETDANIKVRKLPLELEEYGKVVIDAKIDFKQKSRKSYIKGDINLSDINLHYKSKILSIPKDRDIIILTKKRKEERKRDKKKKMSDFDKNFFIDLKINTLDKALYKIEGAEITFFLNLFIKKEFNNSLRILGKIDNINGFYDLKGKKFIIYNSTIAMRGLKEINPLLDIKLKHILPEVTIYIYIIGDKNRPRLKFLSDPLMSKKEIFSYLIFGTSIENIGKGDRKGNYSKTALFFLSNAMTKDIAESLGVDKIELNEGEGGKGVDIKVGKRLSKKLMIIYKNSADKNSIKMEYDINKNFGIESENGESENSIDLFFKKRY